MDNAQGRTHDIAIAIGCIGILALPLIVWDAIHPANAGSRRS